MERKHILRIVIVALFAALIAAGAFIKIPFFPVPITLQTLFTLFAAVSLPPTLALLSVLVYLFVGALGLPVFTTGGGLAAMLGPTGGYLIGLLPAAFIGAVIMKKMGERVRLASVFSAAAATVIIYAVGLPWLSSSMSLSLSATLTAGLVPFLIGDIVKYIVTVAVAPAIRGRVMELLEKDD